MSPDHDDDVNFRRLMNDMLSQAFDADGLRRFVTQRCSAGISTELPGEGASLAAMVHTFIEVGLRHGIFDDEFFARLVEERPRLRGDIAAVRAYYQRWQVDTGRAMQRGFELRLRIGRFFIMIVLGFVSVAMGRVLVALMAAPPAGRRPAGEPEVYVPPPPPWIREPPPKAEPPTAWEEPARSWPPPSEMPAAPKAMRRPKRLSPAPTPMSARFYRVGPCVVTVVNRELEEDPRVKHVVAELRRFLAMGGRDDEIEWSFAERAWGERVERRLEAVVQGVEVEVGGSPRRGRCDVLLTIEPPEPPERRRRVRVPPPPDEARVDLPPPIDLEALLRTRHHE